MARRKRAVGVIRCGADAKTLNAIAETGGLTVESAEAPNHFYVINSGRNFASEVAPALFAEMTGALDNAVREGEIPPWSIVDWPGPVRLLGAAVRLNEWSDATFRL